MSKWVKRLVSVLLVCVLVGGAGPIGGITANAADIPDGYTPIYTAQELYAVRSNLSGNFILMNDIDLSGYANWMPIGGVRSIPFTGEFNGNGFVIRNMTVNVEWPSDIDHVGGLFGSVKGALIRSVGIVNSSVTVKTEFPDSFAYAGGIAGFVDDSNIVLCYNTGSVTAIGPNARAGGIVGYTYQPSDCQVLLSYNTGAVTAKGVGVADVSAGGIVGAIQSDYTIIMQCYNVGIVQIEGIGKSFAGGIVGSSGGMIVNCYNRGTIISTMTAPTQVLLGGIAAYNRYMTTCYSTGGIQEDTSNNTYIGGLAGYTDYRATDSYCRNNVSKLFGYTSGTTTNSKVLTDAQMRQQASFTGFNFDSVWGIDSTANINSGYPYLRSHSYSNHDPVRHLNYWWPSESIPFRFTNNLDEGWPIEGWLAAMRNGMNNWNNSDAPITFQENASSGNTVTVLDDDEEAYGWLSPQATGSTLNNFTITMNSRTTSTNYIASVFAHELGHSVGLRDFLNGNPSGGSDNGSLMNYDRDRSTLRGPTTFDVQSVNMLYGQLNANNSVEQASRGLEVMQIAADYPHYESIALLASRATDIVRAIVLDERVERLNTMLDVPPPEIDPYKIYTIYRIQVVEVFQGNAIPGGIIEIRQMGGRLDNDSLENLDYVQMEPGNDLVLFLRKSFIANFPSILVNAHQSAYQYQNTNEALESAHPENNLSLTLEDLEIISELPTPYLLSVTYGRGNGTYTEGQTAVIEAKPASAGQRFKQWNILPTVVFVDNTRATDATAKFIMPAEDVTATAIYEDIPQATYTLTVIDGSGSGEYEADAIIPITADAPPRGKVFDTWTSASGSFADANSVSTTFTMPAEAVTVTATYKNAPVTTYTLSVIDGSGSGNYEAGAIVPIIANAPPSGKVFGAWTATSGSFADVNSASTTFTMPAEAVTVTATYKNAPATTYTLTVINGSDSGEYEAGANIPITADAPPSGKTFDTWTAASGSFADVNSASTTFTMPAEAVMVTATYKDAPATTYTLTVIDGSGSGEYEADASIPIIADTPPSGKIFDAWSASSGSFADASSASTTFTMPAEAVTVTATYKDAPAITYTLTVNGGSGSGDYPEGASVPIVAGDPLSGKVFDVWTATNGSFTDANSASTAFTMPAGAATVTATYKNAPTSPADKTALNARLDAIGNTQKGKYTDDTWNAFQSALNAARSIASNGNATQDQVNSALNALNAAFANLREKKFIFTTRYEATIWNWIMFFLLFGWIWMWF